MVRVCISDTVGYSLLNMLNPESSLQFMGHVLLYVRHTQKVCRLWSPGSHPRHANQTGKSWRAPLGWLLTLTRPWHHGTDQGSLRVT